MDGRTITDRLNTTWLRWIIAGLIATFIIIGIGWLYLPWWLALLQTVLFIPVEFGCFAYIERSRFFKEGWLWN